MKKHIAQTVMALLLLVSAFFLSKEGAQLANGTPKESKGVIVVDSGHGGIDPGVIGQNEVKEKEINLAIAKKLERLLKAAGYDVIMTRKKDEGLYEENSPNKKVQDMQKRCEIIKENHPLLTVRTVIRMNRSVDRRCFIMKVQQRGRSLQYVFKKH